MLEQLNRNNLRLPSLRAIRELTPLGRREMRLGLTFLSPWIFGFIAFTFLPITASLIFSFLNLKITDGILSRPEFVGLDNYKQLFTDPQIWTGESGNRGSLWITIRFGLIALPVGILLPLGLALLLNNPNLKGGMALRSLFYMPYIIPFVAAIFLWGGMLNAESGWINRALMSTVRDADADVMVIALRGHAQFHFAAPGAKLRPFVLVGAGSQTSSSSNRTIIDLDTDHWAATACRLAGRNLTDDVCSRVARFAAWREATPRRGCPTADTRGGAPPSDTHFHSGRYDFLRRCGVIARGVCEISRHTSFARD